MNSHRFPFVVRLTLRAVVPLALLIAACAPVAALDSGPYTLEILVDGRPLEEHASRGKTYIEALEGQEYAVRLRNRTGERIAVALSVDGLNSIDAKTTTARSASKWILGPYETVTLEGWQTGASTARRFFFTTEEQSYGAWMGKTANLGIVSAAVFREKRPTPRPIVKPGRSDAPTSKKKGRRSPAPAGDSSRAMEGSPMPEARSEAGAQAAPAPTKDLAATGIGERIEHRVKRVRFEAERSPAARLEVRYEYRDALVRLGVLPRPYRVCETPLARRECARGFEADAFAPDPYAR